MDLTGLSKSLSKVIEAGVKVGQVGAIAWRECTANLKRVGRYTPQEGDRVICLYQGNGVYGLEATVVTVAHSCERAYIRFDDGVVIPFSFDNVMLCDRYYHKTG